MHVVVDYVVNYSPFAGFSTLLTRGVVCLWWHDAAGDDNISLACFGLMGSSQANSRTVFADVTCQRRFRAAEPDLTNS